MGGTRTLTKGDRRRLSADETRERLIAAGLESLIRDGMSIGIDSVSLEQAVKDAGVSRSSAYAAWSTSGEHAPQALFQRTVLMRAIDDRKKTIAALQATSYDVIERMGPEVRPVDLFRELCRVAGGSNARLVAESPSWQLVVALRAVLHSASTETRDDELTKWVSDSEAELRNETINDIYRPLAEMVGLRPRSEFGDEAFQYGEIAASSLAEGLSSRYFMESASYLVGIELVGPAGDEEWSLFGLMFEAIALRFFEPVDPDAWFGR